MAKRKKLITVSIILASVVLFAAYWAFQYKIVSGEFDRLTVSRMDGTTIKVVKDSDEIAKIISDINESPRTFQYNSGLTYDYLPHGILTFENETDKVQVGFILSTGKTITKYWVIHTEFIFDQ